MNWTFIQFGQQSSWAYHVRLVAMVQFEWKPLALLAVVVLLGFWKIVFADHYTYYVGDDLAGQYYPWYQFAGFMWKSGHIPLWDPYSRSGRLFFDEMQAGAFYPLNIILFLLPARNGGVDLKNMDLLLVLSAFIAGAGEYSFLRFLGISRTGSLFGAIVFALGGYNAFILGHQSIFEGVIWLPLISLFFLRALESHGWICVRHCLVSGAFLGLTILAGHLQPAGHACLILGFFALALAFSRKQRLYCRLKIICILGATIAFAIWVAAIQLIPTYLYSLRAYRWVTGLRLTPGQRIPFELHEVWSPLEYISLLIPSSTSHQYYLGIATLILALYGMLCSKNRYAPLYSILAILSFLYSWGRISSLYTATYLLVPFIEKIPEAARSFLIFHFSMAALASFGADVLSHPVPKFLRRRFDLTSNLVTMTGAGILLTMGGVAIFLAFQTEPVRNDTFIGISVAAVLFSLTLSIAILRRYRFFRLRVFRASLIFLIAFDLVSFFQAHTPQKNEKSADRMYAETSTIRFLRSLSGFFRVVDLDHSLPHNFGDAYRIPSLYGYGATLGKDYLDFLDSGPLPNKAARMLNARYYVSKLALPELSLIHKDEATGVAVYEDTLALSRVSFVEAGRVKNEWDMLRLGQIHFDRMMQKRGRSIEYSHSSQDGAELRIAYYSPEKIVIDSLTQTSGYLWMSELAYPGWSAYIDGKPEQLLISDQIFRAVPLGAGQHRIVFRFRSRSFYIGFVVSLIGLLVLAFSLAIK